MPVTTTHPTTTTVTAIRISLARPTAAGPMVTVWTWLMAPEWSAARAKDSMERYAGLYAVSCARPILRSVYLALAWPGLKKWPAAACVRWGCCRQRGEES